MSKEFTLLRALRERKTIQNKVAQARQRATGSAVTYEDREPDFKVEEQINIYDQKQNELRQLKVEVAKASLKHTVFIPENAGVPEAGTKVPVFQAILIRDDLKGKKSFLESFENFKVDNDPLYGGRRMKIEGEELVKKKRHFELDKILAQIEELQGSIDEIDAAIQYVDSTKKISL